MEISEIQNLINNNLSDTPPKITPEKHREVEFSLFDYLRDVNFSITKNETYDQITLDFPLNGKYSRNELSGKTIVIEYRITSSGGFASLTPTLHRKTINYSQPLSATTFFTNLEHPSNQWLKTIDVYIAENDNENANILEKII